MGTIIKHQLEYLAYRCICHYRNNSGAIVSEYKDKKRFFTFGTAGSPNIICVIKGRYIGLDVKALKTKRNDNQKEFQAAINAAGVIYFLVRSLDEAVEVIEDAIKRVAAQPESLIAARRNHRQSLITPPITARIALTATTIQAH